MEISRLLGFTSAFASMLGSFAAHAVIIDLNIDIFRVTEATVTKNAVLGENWEVVSTGGFIPNFIVQPVGAHDVTVNFTYDTGVHPSTFDAPIGPGEPLEYVFSAFSPTSGSIVNFAEIDFQNTSSPNVLGTLDIKPLVDPGLLLVSGSDLIDPATSNPYDTLDFILTRNFFRAIEGENGLFSYATDTLAEYYFENGVLQQIDVSAGAGTELTAQLFFNGDILNSVVLPGSTTLTAGDSVRDRSGLVFEVSSSVINPVPIPAAVWLFGSGLLGMFGIARKRKAA